MKKNVILRSPRSGRLEGRTALLQVKLRRYLALPLFDLLFPSDCSFCIFVKLEPNQPVKSVPCGKPGNGLGFVFPNPLQQIGGNADISVPRMSLASR